MTTPTPGRGPSRGRPPRPLDLCEALQPIAETLKAIAHPLRLRIIEILAGGERCVGEIVEALGAKPAITSQQLGLLRDKRVLRSRREGNRVFYRIEKRDVIGVIDCIRKASEADSGRA